MQNSKKKKMLKNDTQDAIAEEMSPILATNLDNQF